MSIIIRTAVYGDKTISEGTMVDPEVGCCAESESWLDIIGIGALNLDYIAPRGSFPTQLLERFNAEIGKDHEKLVEDEKVNNFLKSYGTDNLPSPNGDLGGSTFNMVRTIRAMNLGLKIGYVGVVGEPEGHKFIEFFDRQNIDTQYLFRRNYQSSKCFGTFDDKRQRKLMTGRGATRFLVDCIRDKAAETGEFDVPYPSLTGYLASSRWIHITSFHDLHTLEFFREHLVAAKRRNPALRLSFDMGYQYATDRSIEVVEMAKLADFLFFSEPELSEFVQAVDTPGNKIRVENLATRLFTAISSQSQVIALKKRTSTLTMRSFQGQPEISRYWHRPLLGFEIKSDVGAGDVFAGGYVAGHLVPIFDEYGQGPANLATDLVRTKLRLGDDGYDTFPRVTREHIIRRRVRETLNWRQRANLYAPRIAWVFLGIAIGVVADFVFQWLQLLFG